MSKPEDLRLTEDEWTTITIALHAAAERYDKDAQVMVASNVDQLAAQFRNQKQEALALAFKINEKIGL